MLSPAGMSVDLRAVTELGGVPYEFWLNNNEREDFRNHSLSVFVLMPDSGALPMSGERRRGNGT